MEQDVQYCSIYYSCACIENVSVESIRYGVNVIILWFYQKIVSVLFNHYYDIVDCIMVYILLSFLCGLWSSSIG